MLSNRVLAMISLALIVGAISDGVLYNRPEPSSAIYPIDTAHNIEIRSKNTVVLALQQTHGAWRVTAPFHAPATESRVALLLESNVQTARSYTIDELTEKDPTLQISNTLQQVFSNPIELRVDDNLFLLGDIEPVSQLRYVSANNKVFLQADHIVPLLHSLKSTFTDLQITESVSTVTIEKLPSDNDTAVTSASTATAAQLSYWDHLHALTVVDSDVLKDAPAAVVSIDQSKDDSERVYISHYQQHIALRPHQSDFAYIISEDQASKLGICVYC